MTDQDQLIADALAALEGKMQRDGLPTFHDCRMAVVDAALRLHAEDAEHLLLYRLDSQHRLLGVERIAIGSGDTVTFSRALIARRAIAESTAAVILIHNHPSSDARPSQQDIDAADRIDRQLAAVNVLAMGHFVVSISGYGDIRTGEVVSFKDLVTPETSTPSGPRCPHCHGPL